MKERKVPNESLSDYIRDWQRQHPEMKIEVLPKEDLVYTEEDSHAVPLIEETEKEAEIAEKVRQAITHTISKAVRRQGGQGKRMSSP